MLRVLAFALFSLVMAVGTGSANAQVGQTLALVGGTVYASPTTAPLRDAAVIVSGGTITAVGIRSDVRVPQGARIIDCSGRSLTAGFWNSHVHFTEPVWTGAASSPADALTRHMQDMLTKWGFSTVWDLGSNPSDLLPLRRRVEAGEVLGPRVFPPAVFFRRVDIQSICPPKCNCRSLQQPTRPP
jgi:imidazolonepropionase-like amidohydrolase